MPRVVVHWLRLVYVVVPVMQVRPVRISVHDLCVAVGVAVPHLRSEARMLVEVLAIVVAVAVDMLELGMCVGVSMLTPHERRHRGDQQRAGRSLRQPERFAQEGE
jgi:hypothetical protein